MSLPESPDTPATHRRPQPEPDADRAAARRPDESMSLLNRLMDESLDVSYRQAAPRQEQSTRPGSGRSSRAGLLVATLAIGMLLGLSAADARAHLPTAERERAELAERVQQRTAAVEDLAQQAAHARQQVAQARAQALAFSAEGRRVNEQLTRLELAVGATPVSGPGLRIELDDAPTAAETSGQLGDPRAPVNAEGRVRDRDVQQVVNGLWASGAEAVAVDGVRLSARTAIRAAGEAILVDFRPIIPPYVIDAIGDPEQLPARFAGSPGGSYLAALQANWGIRGSILVVEELHLPAASTLDVRFAAPTPS